MWRQVFVVLTAGAVVACASSERSVDGVIQLGIERLGSDAASRSGAHNFRTAVNVTGVSLPYSVGSIVTNPGGTLPELLAVPQSYGCSKIIETIYDSSASANDVSGVSRAIDLAASALAMESAVNIRLAILDAADGRAREIRANEEDATKAPLAVEENAAITAAREALGMADFTPDAVLAKRTELQAELAAARQRQEAATIELQRLRAIPNLMIFRWSGSEARRAGFSLGEIFGLNSQDGQDRSGYIVLAGVRTAALSPGADFAWATEFAREHPDYIERAFGDRYVTTFTLAARHVAFAEDRNWAEVLRAELNLTPAELNLLVGGDVGRLLSRQSARLEAAFTEILAASSQGLISAPRRTVYEFRMTGVEARQYSAAAEYARNNQYSTIYSTRSTIEDAANATSGASRPTAEYIRSPLVWRCMHAVTARRLNGAQETPRLTGPQSDGGPVSFNSGPEISVAPTTDAVANVTNAKGEPIAPLALDLRRLYFCRPAYDDYVRDPFGLEPEDEVDDDLTERDLGWLMQRPAGRLSADCIDLTSPTDISSVDTK
ncbi:MAG TPA: hypothetical protein VEA80_14565 [Vitreimonas sp.]|uniref:hypothetical protein n=1 Tax=Vitreimonas sp. TaxID=3069702 RepID=UPI002D253D9E|nr:hypothetical protein [Vitreimonas sp.]HYD88694.1 hypothetical protein [Vitreimonas sp.]